jgi:acyl-CoA synthetase (AMP-forming)/AMP-acid ligase II
MLINHFLENSAQKYPDKLAVWFQNHWSTYAEIDSLANRLANYLIENNVKPGDRVAILYENSVDYIISYFAILKAGAITVALNTDTTSDSLIYALNDSGAKAIITNKKYDRYLIPAIQNTPDLKNVITTQKDMSAYEGTGRRCICLQDIYGQGDDSSPGVQCADVDAASIVYTSGSSGKPKGVTLSHLNVVSNTLSIVQYLELTETDRIMVVLPFYYIYGQSLLTTHFYIGGSVVVDNRFTFPQVVLQTMQKNEVTGFSGVPSTFMILLNKSAVRKFTFDKLRYVTQAGGAMAAAIQQETAKVFAPAKLYIMYGTTEASPRLSYVEPEMLSNKWGSIGRPIPNVEMFIVDDKGQKLPANTVGEIVARGPNIMMGYWNDPAGTAEVLKNGLYYTGDLGEMDEDGYFYIVGRSKDIIKSGGFRLSPKEIEEALLSIEGVFEVAVIGMQDEILGEAIKAYIVTNGSTTEITEDTILKSLANLLPPYKHPKYIEFRTQLPKNKSGKIMKTELKKELLES